MDQVTYTQNKTTSLMNEPPYVVSPTLCKILGANKAIILNQIQYWLVNPCTKNNIREGRRWVHNPMVSQDPNKTSWAKNFEFMGLTALKRAFSDLEKTGILLSNSFNRDRRDSTKWYTIDYDVLLEIECQTKGAVGPTILEQPPMVEGDKREGRNETNEQVTFGTTRRSKCDLALPETTETEGTTGNTLGNEKKRKEKKAAAQPVSFFEWTEEGWSGDRAGLKKVFDSVVNTEGYPEVSDMLGELLFDLLLREQHRWWRSRNAGKDMFESLVTYIRLRYTTPVYLRYDITYVSCCFYYGVSELRSEKIEVARKTRFSFSHIADACQTTQVSLRDYCRWVSSHTNKDDRTISDLTENLSAFLAYHG